MARENTSKAFNIGGAEVRVTLPDEVVDTVTRAWSQTLDHQRGRRTAKRAAATEARAKLSADRIVDVALEQMRVGGYEAVTMRSIARELGTGPASLYAHVANREELDALVLDRVAGLWEVPDPDPKTWDQQLSKALHDLLALYRKHPGVARASMGMIPTQPGGMFAMERVLGLLKAGRIPEQYMAWFIDLMTLYVSAVAVEEDIWRQRGVEAGGDHTEESVVGAVREFFSNLPPEHFPLMSAMAGVMTSGVGDDRFDFAVDVLIGGLKAISTRGAHSPG